ncbi:malto-oligosyltrehalose synthase [Devosia albogilva]|uniref:Malto-oligosyltrehalose synthase n=1 Tax=Devosia albogilva TaxID=429726 RepID=A0ABW5QLC4_9HYPH
MITPRATYRLQLNKDFTFADALALVPYLEELGVSHAYLSPILKARAGSTHGYDTVDHTQLNPELGTMAEFRALADALHQRGMGVLLDFVPNHVGVGGSENPIWLDLLKHGQASRYAEWFDVDWSAGRPGATGKVLVPFLGSTYAEALAAGQIRLKSDGEDGFAVWVYDNDKLPVRPEDAAALVEQYGSADAAVTAHTGHEGDFASWGALDRLIASQHWRLVHFGAGGDEMNYRRFFVNSELAGIRIDRDEVFEHAHRLVFELIAEVLVDGLRIDHIDGLLDPKRYLEQLRARSPRPIWLLIEKILAPHEQLRPDWPVDGTTGYEAGAELIRLVTRAEAEPALTAAYADFVGEVTEPDQEEYRTKLRVMDNELAAELESLAKRFAALAWSVPETRDLTELQMRRVLRETVAHLSVYRTYADGEGVSSRDRREIGRALALARRTQPQVQPIAFDFVERVLCGTLEGGYDPEALRLARGRFQQYSGPVMAKGLEDTTLYRYNRLVSLNDVGAHPDRFSLSIAAFHDSNRRRLVTHPSCMIATSTHDTKRGEDVRAFIAAIADEPELWGEAVNRWRQRLSPAADAVHPNDLYLLFQLLVGGWPVGDVGDEFAQRLKDAMMKSVREARERSDWGVNNTGYEEQVFGLIDALLGDARFLEDFHPVRERIQAVGRRKALVQAALKLTIPGVPDIYRGGEDWEQSFVDPDNRRPVDFARLKERLASPEKNRDEKIVLTRTLLRLRCRLPEVFSAGSYEPIDAGEDIIAFRRSHGDKSVVVIADLSRGHSTMLPQLADLPTAFGSTGGPVWVLASA